MSHFIVPYNPHWKTEFEALKAVFEAQMQGLSIDIQHVGSTSVPNLCAKPILDIDLIIEDKTLLNEISTRLQKIGYLCKGEQGIAGRFAFRQSSAYTPIGFAVGKKWQTHHLYVCFSDSLALKNHLIFRDALLKDKSLLEDYAKLKEELLTIKDLSREKYTQLKTDFILNVLANNGLNQQEIKDIREANS